MSDFEEEDREKYPKRWVMGGQVYDRKPMIGTPAEESWSDPLEEVKQHAASAFDKHINHLIEHGPEHSSSGEPIRWQALSKWQGVEIPKEETLSDEVRVVLSSGGWIAPELEEAYGRATLDKVNEVRFQQFETGAVRDTQEGKPRYTLISPKFKRRLAEALTKGAEHYGSHNWHKGIPVERSLDSLLRHLEAFIEGRTDEDHLANAACNLMFIMEFENTQLDDRYDWGK